MARRYQKLHKLVSPRSAFSPAGQRALSSRDTRLASAPRMWAATLCSAILATALVAACTRVDESPTASPATPPTTQPTVSRTPLAAPTSTAQPLQGIERLIQTLDDSDARVQAIGGLEEMGTDGRKAVPALVGLVANDDDVG